MAEMLQSTISQATTSSSSLSSSLFSALGSRSILPLAAFSLPSCSLEVTLRTALSMRRVSTRQTSSVYVQLQDQASTTTSHEGVKWWERDLGANLANIGSAQELTDIVATADGKLVIVEFFASWCGSCRALYPKLCRLARQHKDVVFVKVNSDESKELCKSLNIKVLPYFQLYRGELQMLDSFSCSLAKLQKLKDAIAKFGVSKHSTHGPKA